MHDRCRLAVRGEPLVIADGRLERREGVINVLVHEVRRLDRGDLPGAEVRHIEPRRTWSSEAALPYTASPSTEAREIGDLRAVAPAANSFGRGRG
ncbi:MAG TPA: hypothetical protein VGV10_02360 [Thermoleophilaceae bacterium]|nr:hypothetical protein [Thermoleophilaceae bacterium]